MTHAHITAWLITLILFVIALNLHKSGKVKGFKILHMIIRVFYLLIILTGGMLLFSLYHISLLYILKAVAGLWIISLFELILIKSAKQEKISILWTQFVVAFLIVLYLGLKLPLGIQLF
jgi:phosphatidylserine synthase